jgi:hypothetical protein
MGKSSKRIMRMRFTKSKIYLLFISILFVGFILLSIQCTKQNIKNSKTELFTDFNNPDWCLKGISDLKPGDILIKPNVGFLPGSSFVPNGRLFGHAAIVITGYKNDNIDTLLSHVKIVEAIARDVPPSYQVREISGYVVDKNLAKNSTSFGPDYAGNRYRLRMRISQNQIDSIIAFVLDQKKDLFYWNAMKSFPDDIPPEGSTRKNWADNSDWYCTLLIWQAVFYVTSIDLDMNGGYQVFPNDMILNKYFDIQEDHFPSRVRF